MTATEKLQVISDASGRNAMGKLQGSISRRGRIARKAHSRCTCTCHDAQTYCTMAVACACVWAVVHYGVVEYTMSACGMSAHVPAFHEVVNRVHNAFMCAWECCVELYHIWSEMAYHFKNKPSWDVVKSALETSVNVITGYLEDRDLVILACLSFFSMMVTFFCTPPRTDKEVRSHPVTKHLFIDRPDFWDKDGWFHFPDRKDPTYAESVRIATAETMKVHKRKSPMQFIPTWLFECGWLATFLDLFHITCLMLVIRVFWTQGWKVGVMMAVMTYFIENLNFMFIHTFYHFWFLCYSKNDGLGIHKKIKTIVFTAVVHHYHDPYFMVEYPFSLRWDLIEPSFICIAAVTAFCFDLMDLVFTYLPFYCLMGLIQAMSHEWYHTPRFATRTMLSRREHFGFFFYWMLTVFEAVGLISKVKHKGHHEHEFKPNSEDDNEVNQFADMWMPAWLDNKVEKIYNNAMKDVKSNEDALKIYGSFSKWYSLYSRIRIPRQILLLAAICGWERILKGRNVGLILLQVVAGQYVYNFVTKHAINICRKFV